ncbi:MAG TPA: DUF1552 domain-containing protein [Blastocatellia bacterium]|nr:DUF1552 domain-containing protein [Blastocatellia bacterium]
MKTTNLTSRRNFLRGAGVALTLPWLESASLLAQDGRVSGTANANKPPVRFAHIFFSNGVEPAHWWAKGQGKDMEFGPGAQPLAPIREDLIFIRGLYHQKAFVSTSPHLGRMNLLSGATVSLDPKEIRVGTSIDQVLAQRIGNRTATPSLALGIEPNELRLEDGLSMIYGSNISWVSPTKPATKEIYPSRLFDQLAGDSKGRELDRSVLDAVLAEARSLRPKINAGDRKKLDEYLESIRDIEKRIDHAAREERLEGWRPSLKQANMPRPADQVPQNIPEHMKLMLDLIVLAFQMDKTRVVTLMLNNDLSQMNFKFIEGVRGALHLDLTHNGKAPEFEAMYLKTNQFHAEQFTYLVQRLKGIDEGGTSLLDNSILMFASSLFDGDAHSAEQLPIVLAGKAGGAMRTGRILDYFDQGDDNRRACSLYLSLMDLMGAQLDRFGDTDKGLAGLQSA